MISSRNSWAWTRTAAISLLIFGFSLLPARGEEAPAPAPEAALYQPSRLPDRVVLTWTGDPRTTQAVTWRTSTDVAHACAEIAVAEDGPGFKDGARRVEGQTRPFESDLSRCHVHTVEFKDLSPGTRYVYRVGDGVYWSEWFQFRTAAAQAEPFTFIYLGDAQNDIRSLWSRVIREAFANAPRAAFVLHAGDLVNRADRDAEWGAWFGGGGWLNGMIPVVATPGNHEYASETRPDGSKVRRLSRHWGVQFAFPRNGPPGLETSVYHLDYQDLRLISLNSNERHSEQASWLEKVLADNDRTWTVVTFHHPIYSMARERDNPEVRAAWKPILDRYAVDLVLAGHDHTYGRSAPSTPEVNVTAGVNWRSAPGGTVYVVSVSGPKMYQLRDKPPTEIRRAAENTQLYQIISIDGPVLRYEARTATGALYDAFTLKKRKGGPNEMIEQVPPTPERRCPPSG